MNIFKKLYQKFNSLIFLITHPYMVFFFGVSLFAVLNGITTGLIIGAVKLSSVWGIPVLLILFGAALTAYKIRQDKKK